MFVTTTQAATILTISPARVRWLLQRGRIEGAFKVGKNWLIPLFGNKPLIKAGRRGPQPRWRNPRVPAKTIIHVNRQALAQNQSRKTMQPVISVKQAQHNFQGHGVEIKGACRIVYAPERPNRGGARVWLETLSEVEVLVRDAKGNTKKLVKLGQSLEKSIFSVG